MAGRRQHYIPRFLQRGFLAERDTVAERTYLHRRDAQPTLVGIRDVGVGEDFYSKFTGDGTKSLDDLITDIERGALDDLSIIKSAPAGDSIDSVVAVRLIAHLTVRTAHVRTTFQRATNRIVDEIGALFSDSSRVRKYLRVDDSGPNTISARITDELMCSEHLAASDVPPALLERLVAYFVREHFDEFLRDLSPSAIQGLAQIQKGLGSIIRDSHNSALDRAMPDLSGWAKGLVGLSWRTHAVAGAILPDCVVLARESGRAFTPFLICDKDKLDLVVLPVAHDLLLVGAASTHCSIDISSVNAASAACSDRFFISHCARDSGELSALIGERSHQAIEESIEEALSDLRNAGARHPIEEQSATYEVDSRGPISFSVTCIGFADDRTASRLGEVVQVVVHELARSLPLSRLDGLTFAQDYAAALADLDRGDPALGQSHSKPRDYGQAVAKCVTVMRAGERKEHIVVDAVIAEHLLSEDSVFRASAAHVLVSRLADVAHSVLWEERLGGAPSGPVDEVLRVVHPAVATAPSNYFCARESAFADPTAGERYAALVRDSLKAASDGVRSARLSYRQSHDLDELLGVALERTSFVVGHAAEWLGHRDGLSTETIFPGSGLSGDLSGYGLHHWLELLGRDLRGLYEVEGQFTARNIYALARHAERLLWMFQVCPWLTDEGRAYISVPMGDDARLLSGQ